MLTLRPYQRQAIDYIYKYFSENDGNPVVELPTGTGKSLVMAYFIKEVLEQWSDQRIFVVTHVAELITQNYAELIGLCPNISAGIYSAGLGRRDRGKSVMFAGIQSIHSKASHIKCDLLLVDEAHLIPKKSGTMYRRFIDNLKAVNPDLKVIGLTATPYRTDSGTIYDGDDPIFDHLCYKYDVKDAIKEGYLAPLITKATSTELDTKGVGTRGGDFIAKELQAAVDIKAVTESAVDEIISAGHDRRSWIVFGTGVDHCEHIRDAFHARGVDAECILGETDKNARKSLIKRFKNFELRCLISRDVLTTGFNAPAVDLIGMLRPTKSTGLYVQICGRGMRTSPDKDDCLVLDFGKNIERFGPIDTVQPRQPGKGDGEAPVKVCPECASFVHISVMQCPDCNYMFPPPPPSIKKKASELDILSTAKPVTVDVTSWKFSKHNKIGKPPSLKVEYQCGIRSVPQWICLEHQGYARKKAENWWKLLSDDDVPSTIDEALELVDRLRMPPKIDYRQPRKHPEVVKVHA